MPSKGRTFPEKVTVLEYRAPASTSSVCGTRRVYDSYIRVCRSSLRWTDTSERADLTARALDFPYGT